ncbi:MAG: 3-hydroxyacyl-[acyl-carrier-protein] dehydratase FabZ [Sulfurimonas sp. RIFOXYD12_FULL_36_11]|jgi:3-hydroxyacyl-[acyl-carrier-protein] dehydratase|nr:MAG: 3-hydroxyacyl-[acyl-carrier-protein] dehydratase FabZ [Sulfurimonas sp. RIFOXYB12_FULL_35_9]OHE11752.1 MAG: 3-hydroxyacyl-[acyl-carrier-protein] dehydratase FabZ [Sulfurimonas sp. RIFOXYC2_FULL_36_7]OHE12379.1 MAG: 3-hydroxyacyl-[acyl-carrier-protein] dehydratase FabZ [Sulfurimonas sp. RIFOXYD12_FULL_36_11]
MIMDVMEIQKIIPHRYPFLLLDRVTEIKENESLVGFKNVTIGDNVFQGHFPGHPIYPGVMILEGMAQAGGILAFKSMGDMTEEEAANKVVYFMSIDKAKFRSPVKPGDRLEYRISVIKNRGQIWVLDGKAFVDDVLVSEAELKAMIVDK